jgi:hypothetical protein
MKFRSIPKYLPFALALWLLAENCLFAASGGRHALIICNQNYTSIGKLSTPLAEAREAEKTLSTLGFAGNITVVTDATTVAMNKAVDAFAVQAADAEVAFFFYGGHAVQASGQNYLLGIDSNPESASQLEYEAMAIGRVLREMESSRSKLKLLVLDCCRDNPLPARIPNAGMTVGLAPVTNTPMGTLIAYAADVGQQAWDAHDKIGLYGHVLFHFMKTPGLRLDDIFSTTRKEVSRIAWDTYQHKQEPAEYVKLNSPFYFLPGATPVPGAVIAPIQIPPVPMPAQPVTLSARDRSRIINAQTELASVDSKIAFEQKRWNDNNAIVNKITNFWRVRVQEGSNNHRVCVQAALEMDDAKAKAPELLARKKELEALIEAIKANPSSEPDADESTDESNVEN